MLIFSSATTFTSATVHAQAVDQPDVPKLKISTGEAVLRTTEPPIKNLPNLDELKQKAKDDADPTKVKIKAKDEKLKEAIRCRPSDKNCQEYWKKQGRPSSNIGLLTPSETQTNSFTNLMAANKNPFNLFTSLFNTSDTPFSPYRPPTSHRTRFATMQAGGSTFGGWETEMAQRRNHLGSDSLFSGNYHWSVPVVGLPGRAGHDLSLSLTYNSHQWIRASYGMELLDNSALVGNPGGGFNIGLPQLNSYAHYSRVGSTLAAYLLVMPSGEGIELVRRGGSNASQIYEAVDGSLLRLIVEGSNQYLYFPNGTRHWFVNYQCQEIRDRNGNLMTVSYDANTGLMSKITDTLGRELNFTYNAYYDLSEITQTRTKEDGASITLSLAKFGYVDVIINTNFSVSSSVPNGSILPRLSTVQLSDGSVYKFDYTTYAQVKTVHHYAPLTATASPNNINTTDFRELSTVSYNLPSTDNSANNAAQSDCPRFTTRTDSAFDWASNVVTTFNRQSNYGEVTTPDGTKSREYYLLASGANTAWQDGLPFKTELYAGTVLKRTTLTTWEQAGTVSSTWGPRVYDSSVTDNENNSSRYSSFEYTTYNLPTTTYSYKGASYTGTMVGKSTTSYLLSSPYIVTSGYGATQRRIIGLPAETNSYAPNDATGSSSTNLSRTTFLYDQAGFLTAQAPAGGAAISNHNTASFGATFTARGNLTQVTKWDTVTSANSITSTTKYNTTGSPIEQSLPDNNLTGRSTKISYIDNFTNGITNTLAYPTMVTDPDGFSSRIQYRYDLGVVARTQDPKMYAADSTKGVLKKYDEVGRLKRVENQFTTAYSTYAYDSAFGWLYTLTKANDAGPSLMDTGAPAPMSPRIPAARWETVRSIASTTTWGVRSKPRTRLK